jgi:probable HAF family extracellular repeat protein
MATSELSHAALFRGVLAVISCMASGLFWGCHRQGAATNDGGRDDSGTANGGSGGVSNGLGGAAGGSGGTAGNASGAGGSSGSATWATADLGSGRCLALNARGDVLGTEENGVTFVVTKDGSRSPLGSSDAGASPVGVAIALNGDVVGYSEGMNGRTAMYYSGGTWTAIAGLASAWSAAIGIGDQGQIVGVYGMQTHGETHAFISSGGALGTLPIGPSHNSAAYIAGAGGIVAGIAETTDGQTHAFVVAGDQMRDVGTLGGSSSVPLGMNTRGDVVGAAETAAGVRHAFLAPAGGGALVDLGVPAGALTSEARGIDDQGRIVANVFDASGLSRPIVFVTGKNPVGLLPADTSTNPYIAAYATAMTTDGLITGWGVPRDTTNGAVRCLLWTPGS